MILFLYFLASYPMMNCQFKLIVRLFHPRRKLYSQIQIGIERKQLHRPLDVRKQGQQIDGKTLQD